MTNRTDEWACRIPFAIQWVWPIPLIVLIHYAPESPWFLVRAGRLEEAAISVARIQKKGSRVDPMDAVAMMVRTNEHEKAVSAGASYWDCFRGTDLRRTEIACVAWASQNLSGWVLTVGCCTSADKPGLASPVTLSSSLSKLE
jgi:SP family general alpha glucoside:H+ symporter-like MFS transporter